MKQHHRQSRIRARRPILAHTVNLKSGGIESASRKRAQIQNFDKIDGVKKEMKNKKVTTKVGRLGVAATIIFLVKALGCNNFGSQLLVGSFALICLGLASASMWFRAFGIRNTGRKIKKGQAPSP